MVPGTVKMPRSTKTATIAAAALAQIAAFNPAAPPGQSYPGQRPINDPWISEMALAATKFWRARNVTVPDSIKIDVANNLRTNDADVDDAAARGFLPDPARPGEHRLVLNGRRLGQDLGKARSTQRAVRARRAVLEQVAATIFHEVGHVSGLQHGNDGGVMDTAQVPWEARKLARRLIPRSPRPARDARRGEG